MSGSVAAAYGLSNQELVDRINELTQKMKPYIQYQEFDNGHVLGENVFQFFPSKNVNDHVYGTVTSARLEMGKRHKIYVTVQPYKKHPVELEIRRERAAHLLYKLEKANKYIEFVIRMYQSTVK